MKYFYNESRNELIGYDAEYSEIHIYDFVGETFIEDAEEGAEEGAEEDQEEEEEELIVEDKKTVTFEVKDEKSVVAAVKQEDKIELSPEEKREKHRLYMKEYNAKKKKSLQGDFAADQKSVPLSATKMDDLVKKYGNNAVREVLDMARFKGMDAGDIWMSSSQFSGHLSEESVKEIVDACAI